MIEFNSYSSGSKGNLYTVSDGSTKIMIECGLPWKQIKQALSFNTSEIAGCLISHSHSDHAKSVREVMKAGIDIYTSRQTVDELNVSGHRINPVCSKIPFKLGSWTILPFDLQHDVYNLGFLLVNALGEKCLYITDTYYCRYKFNGLTVLAVECNHSYEILKERLSSDDLNASLKNRLIQSHFSIEQLKEFLKSNDLSKVQSIHMLHLSDSNSDAELFKREIQELTGKPTYIC